MSAAPDRRRWALLLPLLGLAAWLALFGDKTPAGAAKPAGAAATAPPPARAAAPRREAAAAEPVEALRPRVAPEEPRRPTADLFAVAAWRLPPPPPPPPPVVQGKAAPPLPALNYRVLGKKEEDNTWEVYLGRDDLSFIARAGDTLEGLWRVDRIEPPTMTLTHLPSGLPLTLPIGDPR